VKQVLQSLKSGRVEVAEVPAPAVRSGALLIRTRVSLISPGTERMLLEFGKAEWLAKARQQPDKVRQVWEKIRTDGLWPAVVSVTKWSGIFSRCGSLVHDRPRSAGVLAGCELAVRRGEVAKMTPDPISLLSEGALLAVNLEPCTWGLAPLALS
jgi:hypothetical protein